mgnify:CR=1 FL=1
MTLTITEKLLILSTSCACPEFANYCNTSYCTQYAITKQSYSKLLRYQPKQHREVATAQLQFYTYIMSTEQMRFAKRICKKSKRCSFCRQNRSVLSFHVHWLLPIPPLRTNAAKVKCNCFGRIHPKQLHLNNSKTLKTVAIFMFLNCSAGII